MTTPLSTAPDQVNLGVARIASSFPGRDSGASLHISPQTVPLGFGDGRAQGQDFQVTFVNGPTALPPQTAVFVRVNYWIGLPRPLPDAGNETGEEVRFLAPGLQGAAPHAANHVALAENHTSAELRLWPPMYVNPQRRIVKVQVVHRAIRPGESFTLRFGNAFSIASTPLGTATDAGEHAFVAVIGHPAARAAEEQASREPQEYDYEIIPRRRISGGLILPMEAAVVHAVAPSRVRTGEAFLLRLAVLDAEDNVVTGFVGRVAVACPSDPGAAIEPPAAVFEGGEDGTAVVRVTLTTAGVHRFEAALLSGNAGRAEGPAAAPTFHSNPVEAGTDAQRELVLWGDYHGHSWRCDGTGDPAVLVDYARNAAFLDWYALTSHDAPRWPLIGAMRWTEIAALVDDANDEGSKDGVAGRFVTLPAFEWTSPATGDSADDAGSDPVPESAASGKGEPKTNADGHRIVLARSWDTLLRDEVPPAWNVSGSDTAWALHRTMIRRQAEPEGPAEFMIVPHDLLCNNWWAINAQRPAEPVSPNDQAPPANRPVTLAEQVRYVPLAQVYSTLHGNHESPQEDGTVVAEAEDTTRSGDVPGSNNEGSSWRPHSKYSFGIPAEHAGYVAGLKYGGIYGVVAGGDSHSARPGSFRYGALTAVLAADHTREAVFDALLARKTYATSGARLLMEFSCGRATIGDILHYEAADTVSPVLRWRVVAPTPIRRVRIVRVRSPRRGEDVASGDVWAFVDYVVNDEFAGGAETERSGTSQDRGFRAAEWKYASYFLVVSHQGVRPHGKKWEEDAELEERGWTSPIFFRRGDSMDGNAGEAG